MRRHESGGSRRRCSKTDRRCERNFPEADLKEKRGMVIKKGRNRCRKLRGEGIRAKRDYGRRESGHGPLAGASTRRRRDGSGSSGEKAVFFCFNCLYTLPFFLAFDWIVCAIECIRLSHPLPSYCPAAGFRCDGATWSALTNTNSRRR